MPGFEENYEFPASKDNQFPIVFPFLQALFVSAFNAFACFIWFVAISGPDV